MTRSARRAFVPQFGAASLAALAALGALGVAPDAAAQAKKKVLRLGDITVEGRIQKPQAFYILPRQNLNWQGLERSETFLPKISKALEQDPF
jgi:hypothetical protein